MKDEQDHFFWFILHPSSFILPEGGTKPGLQAGLRFFLPAGTLQPLPPD